MNRQKWGLSWKYQARAMHRKQPPPSSSLSVKKTPNTQDKTLITVDFLIIIEKEIINTVSAEFVCIFSHFSQFYMVKGQLKLKVVEATLHLCSLNYSSTLTIMSTNPLREALASRTSVILQFYLFNKVCCLRCNFQPHRENEPVQIKDKTQEGVRNPGYNFCGTLKTSHHQSQNLGNVMWFQFLSHYPLMVSHVLQYFLKIIGRNFEHY